MPTKEINVSKTITITSDVFLYVVTVTENTGMSFAEALNELCRTGMKARAEQAAHEAGGSEDGAE